MPCMSCRPCDPALALRLARFFATSAAFWLNLQTRYELERAPGAARTDRGGSGPGRLAEPSVQPGRKPNARIAPTDRLAAGGNDPRARRAAASLGNPHR